MNSYFKIINKKNIYSGFFKMDEITLKYKKYDGSWSNEVKREIFGGAEVSAVLPYDPKNKRIVLIQQFRPGTILRNTKHYLDEIVAGIVDKNENPENAAKRECFEETGCKIKKIIPIQGYFPAPGSSQSFYHLFIGEVDSPNNTYTKGLETENENIFVKSYSYEEVKKKLKNGEILNGLTLVALQWFFLNFYED